MHEEYHILFCALEILDFFYRLSTVRKNDQTKLESDVEIDNK